MMKSFEVSTEAWIWLDFRGTKPKIVLTLVAFVTDFAQNVEKSLNLCFFCPAGVSFSFSTGEDAGENNDLSSREALGDLKI